MQAIIDTVTPDPKKAAIDAIRAKFGTLPQQSPNASPQTAPQSPAPSQPITDESLLSGFKSEISSYVTQKNQLEAKYGGDVAGRSTEDERKALEEAKQKASDASRQLSAINLNLREVPRAPELQDVQQQMAGLGPTIATIFTLIAAGTGKFGKGQDGVGFARTYNEMVDTFRENNYQDFMMKSKAFHNELESWKTDTQKQISEYTEALNKWQKGQDISKEMAELNLKSAQMPLQNLLTLNSLIDKATADYEKIASKMLNEKSKAMMEAHYKEQERHDRAMESIAKAKESNNSYGLSVAETTALQTAIAEGRLDASRINSRTAKMIASLFVTNPKLDMNNSAATSAALKKMETLRSQTESFAITAGKNFDLVERLYDKNPQGTIMILNKLKNNFNAQIIGDADTVMLGRAIKTALMEYAKVVSGQTGGAAVSDSARAEVETLLSMADRPEAFHGSIANHRQEMRNREEGFQQTINELKGGRGGNERTPGGAPNPTDRIKVKSPSGQVGTIPASQLDSAKKQGYVQVN